VPDDGGVRDPGVKARWSPPVLWPPGSNRDRVEETGFYQVQGNDGQRHGRKGRPRTEGWFKRPPGRGLQDDQRDVRRVGAVRTRRGWSAGPAACPTGDRGEGGLRLRPGMAATRPGGGRPPISVRQALAARWPGHPRPAGPRAGSSADPAGRGRPTWMRANPTRVRQPAGGLRRGPAWSSGLYADRPRQGIVAGGTGQKLLRSLTTLFANVDRGGLTPEEEDLTRHGRFPD